MSWTTPGVAGQTRVPGRCSVQNLVGLVLDAFQDQNPKKVREVAKPKRPAELRWWPIASTAGSMSSTAGNRGAPLVAMFTLSSSLTFTGQVLLELPFIMGAGPEAEGFPEA